MTFLVVSFVCSLMSQLVLQLVLSNCLPGGFHSQVNSWWYGKSKGFGNGAKVERIDVEYITLVVRGVSLEIGAVAVLGCAVQIVVLLNQLHELLLNVRKFVFWELILIWRDLGLLQESQEC